MPLFYSVKPPTGCAARAALALADRAGARVLGAYEWGLGGKTKKANAALAGLGGRAASSCPTPCSPSIRRRDRVVLAHGSCITSMAISGKDSFESVLMVAGFYLASQVLVCLAPAGCGCQDVAGLPPAAGGRCRDDRDAAVRPRDVAVHSNARRSVCARSTRNPGLHLGDASPGAQNPPKNTVASRNASVSCGGCSATSRRDFFVSEFAAGPALKT